MFKVGQVVIGQNFPARKGRNGTEGTVTMPLGVHQAYNRKGDRVIPWYGYGVIWSDGMKMIVRPSRLRPRKPKEKHLGEQIVLDLFKEKEHAT